MLVRHPSVFPSAVRALVGRVLTPAALILLASWCPPCGAAEGETPAAEVGVEDFDRLWDYSDPAATESRFRELLPAASEARDPGIRLQLLTQIARCEGLQGRFEEAHRTLDEVNNALKGAGQATAGHATRVRYLLERGRAFNSSGSPGVARPLFLEAWELALAAEEDFHAVDAAHMLGIVDPPEEALAWNERALKLAESSQDPAARGWLGALYNNIGWTYHDQAEYEQALSVFRRGLDWREDQGAPGPLRIARWCVARCLRSLGRVEEALGMQEALRREFEEAGERDGYVFEELGECLLLLDRAAEARPWFARAYEELSRNTWLAESEAERLERLQELGEVE